MHKYLLRAAALSAKGNFYRCAFVGAVGRRADGTLVESYNGSVPGSTGCTSPSIHAEARLARKLDVGSVVYVARTRRDNGRLAMAKPCRGCYLAMKHRGVSKCYYTIGENEYGVVEF